MGAVIDVYENLFYKTYGFTAPLSAKTRSIAKRIEDACPSVSEQRALVSRFFQLDDYAVRQSKHDLTLLLSQLHRIRCEVRGATSFKTPLEINLRGQNERIMNLVWVSLLKE